MLRCHLKALQWSLLKNKEQHRLETLFPFYSGPQPFLHTYPRSFLAPLSTSISIRMILATWQNVTDKVLDQLSGVTTLICDLHLTIFSHHILFSEPGYLVSQCCRWEKRSAQTVTSSRLKMAPSSCWEAAGLVSWIPGPKRWSTSSPQTQWSRKSPFSLPPYLWRRLHWKKYS